MPQVKRCGRPVSSRSRIQHKREYSGAGTTHRIKESFALLTEVQFKSLTFPVLINEFQKTGTDRIGDVRFVMRVGCHNSLYSSGKHLHLFLGNLVVFVLVKMKKGRKQAMRRVRTVGLLMNILLRSIVLKPGKQGNQFG